MLMVGVVQLVTALWFAVSSGSRVLPVFSAVIAGLVLLGVGFWSKRRRGYWSPPADRVGWSVLVGFIWVGGVVATFLGAFAAFYTTVYASSDVAYRASFSDDTGSSLQQAVDVRRVDLSAKGVADA